MNFTADPETGRFISQDSYRGAIDDPGQWHLYAYCANNPINYVDPSGHKSFKKTITYKVRGKASMTVKMKWDRRKKDKKVKVEYEDVTFTRKSALGRSSFYFTKDVSVYGEYRKKIIIKAAIGVYKTLILGGPHAGLKPWSMMTMKITINGKNNRQATAVKKSVTYDTFLEWEWPSLVVPL